MATNYPGSLDAFVNPASGNTLDSPSHSLQHSDINDAVEALETKLGVGTATPGTATALFPLVAGTAGATSWTRLSATGITSGTATSGQLLRADGSGAAAWATPTLPGLVQVVPASVAVGSGSGSVDANGLVTFSGASSVSLNDVFSATYTNYLILPLVTGSGSIDVNMRLRVSGADNSSANYARQTLDSSGTTTGSSRNTAETSWTGIMALNSTTRTPTPIQLFQPFEAHNTTAISTRLGAISGNIEFRNVAHGLSVTTSYTGFTLIAQSGTITGVVSVYGYR
jgi:hypothetical protein